MARWAPLPLALLLGTSLFLAHVCPSHSTILVPQAQGPKRRVLASAAADDIAAVSSFLSKNGYSSFGRWFTGFLAPGLKTNIENGERYTILAPSDTAFKKFRYRYWLKCEPRPGYMANIHATNSYLRASDFDGLLRGTRVVTMTPVTLTKASKPGQSPLKVGITNGVGTFYGSVASVAKGDALVTSTIVVHGIDTVFRYPSGTVC